MKVLAYGIIAAAAVVALTTSAFAQPAEGTQLNPTHQFKAKPGVVVFKFKERFNCAEREFSVVYTDVSTQTIIWGCGHVHGGREFFLFSDGDIASLLTTQWESLGPTL